MQLSSSKEDARQPWGMLPVRSEWNRNNHQCSHALCITEDVLNFISLESVTPVGFKRSERQGEVHCEHSVKL